MPGPYASQDRANAVPIGVDETKVVGRNVNNGVQTAEMECAGTKGVIGAKKGVAGLLRGEPLKERHTTGH